MNKKHITLISSLIFIIVLSFSLNVFGADTIEQQDSIKAKVIELIAAEGENTEISGSYNQVVKVEILKGDYKGTILEAENFVNSYSPTYDMTLKVGDKVLLFLETNEDGEVTYAYVTGIVRDSYLIVLLLIFIVAVLIIGKWKGLKSIISLAITCFLIIGVLLPLILNGHNPILVSSLTCITIIISTLLIVSGFNRKTFAAIIGTLSGVLIAGILALTIGSAARITGFGNDETQMLMQISLDVKLNFQGLLFAGIIIGSAGAIMDVGMSISSAVQELKETNPELKPYALMKSGMNIGRDIMGTMSNTLILAYTGGALQLMLLLLVVDVPMVKIFNMDYLSAEIVRALAGSIGLVFTIPLTAFIAAYSKTKIKPSLK